MFGYRVPRPDQAMLISGGKQKTEGATFRVVIGHGAWVMPGFRKVGFLGLDLHTVEIAESCRSTEGILLNLKAVVAFKVQSDIAAVNAAAQRFLGDQKKGQMEDMTNRIFAGHLRSIVGSMAVVNIHRNRDELAQNILHHSQSEMSTLGLTVDSFQIEHLDDNNLGYLDDLAAEEVAQQKKKAGIARAIAAQEQAQAEQESTRKQNEQIRETQVKAAVIKSEIDKANAEAEAAGQLAAADVQQRVLKQQQLVADTNAELIERKLAGEQIKPAEADAKAKRIAADADTSVAEAAGKRAEFEAVAAKTRQIKAAEANALQATVTAEAAAKAAEFNANAVRSQAQADADAAEARGVSAAKARKAQGLAEAEATEAQGLAEAKAELAKSNALAANNNARLDLERVRMMPEIARNVAEGVNLGGANLYVANGAEGISQLAALAIPVMQQVMAAMGTMFSRNETEAMSNDNGQQAAAYGPNTPMDISTR
jgi:uncharacterized membrane protein YqiK